MKKLLFLFGILVFFFYQSAAQIVTEKEIETDQKAVWSVAYSSDGKYIATGGGDKRIVIRKTGSWEEVARLEGIKDDPLALCFSNNGKMIAAGGRDKRVTVWNLASRQVMLSLKGHKDFVRSLKFSPNDKYIASGSYDKKIYIWNVGTGLPEKILTGHKGEVTSVDFSPSGDALVSGGADKNVIIWNIKTGMVSRTIPAHGSWVRTVAYNPDGSLIASGGDDRQIHLWDAYSGEKLNTFLGHKQWVQTLVFSPDGNYLASGGHDNLIILTELKTGKMLFKSEKQDDYVLNVAFNPDGETFASSSINSEEVEVWSARSLDIKPIDREVAKKATKKSGMVPKVTWVSPTNNSKTSSATVRVSARIKSESSLRSIQLYVNGQLFATKDRSELMLETAENDFYDYSETIILNEGKNTILIKASNIVGEGTSETVNLTYQEQVVDLFAWINPSESGIETNLHDYEVKAMINPAKGNQQVEVFVNNMSQGVQAFSASGGILSKKVALINGTNTIKLKVTTPNYSKESDVRTINYTKADKPVLAWVSPVTDTISFISSARIQGLVNSQIPIDKVEIKLNGTVVYNKTEIDGNVLDINELIQLVPGYNTITMVAANSAGETISPIRIITYEIPAKTNISWIAPGGNDQVFSPTYNLKACIQSKTKVQKVEVFNNNMPIISEANPTATNTGECTIDFTRAINLTQGPNVIKIVATNAGGTTESETRTISYSVPTLATISWISPAVTSTTTSEGSMGIEACIKSNSPITTVKLLVNNQLITSLGQQAEQEGTCQYPISQNLPLIKGINNVVIKATNMAGESQSQLLTIEYKKTNPYRFALIIGNEDYSSYQSGLESESDVDFAVNDAKEFKETCINVLNISEERIIYHENARHMEMMRSLDKINKLIKATGGKAEVFVYYAGHGFPDEKTNEPYLIPVDVSGTDLSFGGIKLTDFYEYLTEFPAQKITVFLDACFSGGARNQGLVAARGVKVVPKETQEAVKKKLVVYAASSGNQTSLPYKSKQHGMFSYFLLKKLKETKGNVTYKQLSDYLKSEVSVNSLMVNSKEQTPQTNVSPEVEQEWSGWKFLE